MEPKLHDSPTTNLEALPHPGIRRTYMAGPAESRAFHLSALGPQDRDRLSRLEPPGAAAPGEAGWYRGDAADLLCDVSAWSYAEGPLFIQELEHRNIVAPETRCIELPVRNDALLVVATAFLVRSGDVGVVVYRGTEPKNPISFLTDATTEPKPFLAMGRVHGGFHRNLRAVWTDVAEWIDDQAKHGLKALYFTGHSLGGAMAVLATALIWGDERFMAWRPLLQGVYTYGQPPVGDAEFARACDERFGRLHFRHVYGHDLVPRLPPRSTGSFRHSGREYVGDLEGWAPRSRAVEQAYTAALSLPIGLAAWMCRQFAFLRRVRLPYSLDDHSPTRYMEAFRAMRER